MSQLFARICDNLDQGRDICLATIINQIGSAPRAMGVSFLVRADGSIEGTIGGGRLEGEVIQEARRALPAGESRLMHFRLKGEDVAQTDMICGGDVDVYLEPIKADDQAAARIYAAAARVAARGGKALLLTPIQPGPLPSLAGRKLLLIPGEQPVGGLDQMPGIAAELNPEELASQGKPGIWMQTLPSGGKLDLFLEPIRSEPVVYIFGGGHVSQHLAKLIKMVDFRLVVADDRPEFANQERFPQADEIWTGDFQKMLAEKKIDRNAYVVIVTRGHIFDKEVLDRALDWDTVYLGMIGSRRKRALIYKALEESGRTREQLEAVHSPIGLDIGAETPEEIAVAIVAELIQVRAELAPRIRVK